ncbi:hypothetical protein HDU98_010559, partial [Podochytrium sp. JEL0797]
MRSRAQSSPAAPKAPYRSNSTNSPNTSSSPVPRGDVDGPVAANTSSSAIGASLAFLNIRRRIGSRDGSPKPPPRQPENAQRMQLNPLGALPDDAPSGRPGPAPATPLRPRHVSFSEFRLHDFKQLKQRRCLVALQRLDAKYRADHVHFGVSVLNTHAIKKPYKGTWKPKFKDDKRLAFGKLGGLLQKKRRRRSRTEVFHLINLAIIDKSTAFACTLLEDLSSSALRKKFPLHANKAFYSALGQCMEPLCLSMMEKGFPLS